VQWPSARIVHRHAGGRDRSGGSSITSEGHAMRVRNRFTVVVLLCACAMGAGPAFAQDEAPSAQDCFVPAFKAGDADAVAACYAEDGIIWFPGGPMAQGRTAIRDGFAGFFEKNTIKDFRLDAMGQERMGTSMASWGTYSIRMANKDTGVESTESGRFTDVSKLVDGRWLYVVDHPSDDPPAKQE
jgi:uncharacterized protein (TIGR02246 family)